MKAHGLLRKPRVRKGRPGEARAADRREMREVRSYEAEYVRLPWHLDFHHGSLRVLTHRGQWERPLVLGILDDHSRRCCHVQWYLSETAEDLVHGLCQAFQKRGLPRALMTDNGSAMIDGVPELTPLSEMHRGASAAGQRTSSGAGSAAGASATGGEPAGDGTLKARGIARKHRPTPQLAEQVRELLADGRVLTRGKIRDRLRVKNERLGETLEHLEQSGQLRRTPSGWQRAD